MTARTTVVLGLLALAATACSSNGSDTPASSAPASPTPKLVTVQLGAGGVSVDTKVVYSCMDGTNVSVCGPDPITGGVWTKPLTAPVGTTVRVQVSGGVLPPECWIADETGRMTLAGGAGKHMQDCTAVIGQ